MTNAFHGEVGRLNGIYPEPGTVLGPDLEGQWFAVSDVDARGCTVRYATVDDIEDARALGEPRSVAESRGLPA